MLIKNIEIVEQIQELLYDHEWLDFDNGLKNEHPVFPGEFGESRNVILI